MARTQRVRVDFVDLLFQLFDQAEVACDVPIEQCGKESRRCKGNTIDLSISGVKLFSQLAPKVGDSIDLTWTDHEPPVTLGGRVVYVLGDVEGSCAGVLFHRPIDPQTFLVLCKRSNPSPVG